MKVLLTRSVGINGEGHSEGEELDLPEEVAGNLILIKKAISIEPPKKLVEKLDDDSLNPEPEPEPEPEPDPEPDPEPEPEPEPEALPEPLIEEETPKPSGHKGSAKAW